VFAADTGGAIKNDHVDIFTGVSSQSFAPQVFASSPNVKFDAFVVDEPNALAEMRRLHLRS
jgi:hypothetical protein